MARTDNHQDILDQFESQNGQPWKKEQKYFISYTAYTGIRTDFLNRIIHTQDDITEDLIEKIQDSL
jgi:hypothetical protein